MTIESLPPNIINRSRPGWVYALFCVSAGGEGFVKIGFSIRPLVRLSELAASSPLPPMHCGVRRLGTATDAHNLESKIHRKFKDRRTNGEWFKFDLANTEDKADFCRAAGSEKDGWRFFPHSALKEANQAEAKKAFAKFKRQSPDGGQPTCRTKAWDELRKYGL